MTPSLKVNTGRTRLHPSVHGIAPNDVVSLLRQDNDTKSTPEWEVQGGLRPWGGFQSRARLCEVTGVYKDWGTMCWFLHRPLGLNNDHVHSPTSRTSKCELPSWRGICHSHPTLSTGVMSSHPRPRGWVRPPTSQSDGAVRRDSSPNRLSLRNLHSCPGYIPIFWRVDTTIETFNGSV